jgi:hypothetical protein
MAARPDFKVYVELGCWKGHSVCHLAKRLKDKKDAVVYAVDYWDSADTLEASYLPEDSPNLYDIYNRNLEIAGVRCLVQDIKGCSWKSASRFKDESVDFVYLDADHSTESVMRDMDTTTIGIPLGLRSEMFSTMASMGFREMCGLFISKVLAEDIKEFGYEF